MFVCLLLNMFLRIIFEISYLFKTVETKRRIWKDFLCFFPNPFFVSSLCWPLSAMWALSIWGGCSTERRLPQLRKFSDRLSLVYYYLLSKWWCVFSLLSLNSAAWSNNRYFGMHLIICYGSQCSSAVGQQQGVNSRFRWSD